MDSEFQRQLEQFGTESIQIVKGLTFAARRTTIEGTKEIMKILKEDGYKSVNWMETSGGDIALWRSTDQLTLGSIDHSGIVVKGSKVLNGLNTQPLILSKWGELHEVIHAPLYCPYNTNYDIIYFRLDH